MKIKPQIYAQMLIDVLSEKSDLEKVAGKFWRLLQKNKQYKDLPRIMELIDIEYAKKNNLAVAKVYSEEPLTENEIAEIESRLVKYSSSPREARVEKSNINSSRLRSNNKFIIKNIIDKNCGGITVKINDKMIDLSVSGKIDNLKKRLINI